MTYFIDIFSIETYEEFSATDKSVTGFHPKRKAWVSKIKPGDKVLCYLKGLSCWVGVLEITGKMFQASPGEELVEEYSIQFPSKPLVWLDKGALIPIKRDDVWSSLSFTKNVAPGAGGWNANLRSSGVRLVEEDGAIIENLLLSQSAAPIPDGISTEDWEKRRSFKLTNAQGKEILVQIPQGDDGSATPPEFTEPPPSAELQPPRTSHKMQALLAEIGLAMGFQVWIPKADREAVASAMSCPTLLENLPYTQFSTEASAKAVEQIDVLWLQKKAIVRAFEVEHTTAVYSGILRMADLLALQPNFHTKLHIVAPEERRKKVFQELRRPAFSIFPQGPLSELCTYLPYEKIEQLAVDPNLEYLRQEVLDKFEEFAEEAD